MARLPKPGGDADKWAELLNEYLLVSHNPDGTQRSDSFNALMAATIGLQDLKTTNPPGQDVSRLFLSNDGTNLSWERAAALEVHSFGAKGDGITDDTAAIQAAIDAASEGGAIRFTRGTYMVTGLKINRHGVSLVGTARFGVKLKRLSGNAPIIDASGTASVNGHRKFVGLADMTLDGSGLPGPLVRAFFADNFLFSNLGFRNTDSAAIDFVEVWDTYFTECSWENCGSVNEPAVWLRNSMPSGQFGFGKDNTNQIHFHDCRWESFKNGAVWLDGAANGSTNLLNGIFFVACKMETWFAAGSPLAIKEGSTIVFVNQLYMAVMIPNPGYTTPIDAIEDNGSYVSMTNVYIQWGPNITPNSLVRITHAGPHQFTALSSYFSNLGPALGTIVAEPEATLINVGTVTTNRKLNLVGDISVLASGNPTAGYKLPINSSGSFRIMDDLTGKDLVKADNNTTRPAFHVLNSVDAVGYSDNYTTEMWRIVGKTGAARFAKQRFQIEGTKGYVGINATPLPQLAMLIKLAADADRGLAVVRASATANNRLMEFQDETFNIQGMAFDSSGRPLGVGTPPKVAAGDQVTYANPGIQVRDVAGNIKAAVKPSPTAPGVIATVTFSKPFVNTPLFVSISDNSAAPGNLYISARSASGFTVSTRSALQGGSLLNFDYSVIG